MGAGPAKKKPQERKTEELRVTIQPEGGGSLAQGGWLGTKGLVEVVRRTHQSTAWYFPTAVSQSPALCGFFPGDFREQGGLFYQKFCKRPWPTWHYLGNPLIGDDSKDRRGQKL